jgi:hypothetical protein
VSWDETQVSVGGLLDRQFEEQRMRAHTKEGRKKFKRAKADRHAKLDRYTKEGDKVEGENQGDKAVGEK